MTCDTPSIDVSAYPALLAGPIIRRLTRNSVTIWAALSDRDFTDPLNPPNVQVIVQVPNLPGTGSSIVTSSSPLVRIGEHVFLVVVTVTLPATTFFENDDLYQYKLEYQGGALLTDVDGSEIDWSAFSYGAATQPAFAGLCTPGTANL